MAVPRRILLVSDALDYGGEELDAAVAALAEQLCDNGIEATIVRARTRRARPTLGAQLAEAFKAERPELVHVFAGAASPAAPIALRAAAMAGMSRVLTLYASPAWMPALLAGTDAVLGWSSRLTLAAASSVIAADVARWMPAANIAVLPFGIGDAELRSGEKAVRVGGEVRFASRVSMTSRDDASMLLRAFAGAVEFVAGSPTLRLAIVGDGPMRASLQRMAADLGIAGSVEWPGALDDEEQRALYARADAFVLAGNRIGVGLAALEARAAGLPVIARIGSGARDFIAPGVNGLLARDDAELSRFISRVALEEPLRRFMSHRNASAPASYTWAAVLPLYRAVYEAAVTRADAAERPNQK